MWQVERDPAGLLPTCLVAQREQGSSRSAELRCDGRQRVLWIRDLEATPDFQGGGEERVELLAVVPTQPTRRFLATRLRGGQMLRASPALTHYVLHQLEQGHTVHLHRTMKTCWLTLEPTGLQECLATLPCCPGKDPSSVSIQRRQGPDLED